MPIRFDHPELLWLMLLAGPIVWLGMRSLRALDAVRRTVSIALRVGVLMLMVLMLAGLQAVRWHHDLTVVAVVDQSESVRRLATPPPWPDADGQPPPATVDEWSRQWLHQAASNRRPDDRIGVVSFDRQPTVRLMPANRLTLDFDTLAQPLDGTDTAAAIRLGLAMFGPDSARRMVLFSDGTDGRRDEALQAAREAAAAGIPIDVVPIEYRLNNEVMVEALHAPSEAREGQTVALRVVLRSTRAAGGLIRLRHDGQWLELGAGAGLAVAPADWSVESAGAEGNVGRFVLVKIVQLPLAHSGANRFEVIFEPDEGRDTIAANNRAESFTLVHGRGRVLVLDNVGGASGQILPQALRQQGIEVEVALGHGLPTTLAGLQRYDAVLLQNVPADMLTDPQQQMLRTYVNDTGGGLIMLGGPNSFGAGGWEGTPVDEIMPVTAHIPSQIIVPTGALVLVIDRSGSMRAPVGGTGQSRQQIANEAAVLAIQSLTQLDYVGVIAFDHSAQWVVPLERNEDPRATGERVRAIQPVGGTHIYPGLAQATAALEGLTGREVAVKHIILLTDGMDNPGGPRDYPQVLARMRAANITLTTVGIGESQHIDEALLQRLADEGRGTFYHVEDPTLLPRILINEARLVRRHLIKEYPFEPHIVRTGSPIMAGVGELPQLLGLVLTGPRDDPRVFMPLISPDREPVFAHWQVGLGRTAAFTSDATNRWASAWVAWGGYSDFWARTVRHIARPSASRDYDLTSEIRGDRLHVRLDAAGSGGSYANFLRAQGAVLRPDGRSEPIQLQQTGPGLYEAQVPAEEAGGHIVSLMVTDPGGERQYLFGGATRPPSTELRHFESNRAMLEQIAQLTGGRVLEAAPPDPGILFQRDASIQPSRSVRPMWRTLMLWLLALLLLDVACRRIAWDYDLIRRWLAARAAALRQSLASRETEAGQTLAALKNRAQQTEQRLGSAEPPPPGAPPEQARRRFEAAPRAAASRDFTAAVGGARGQGANSSTPQPQSDTDAADGATTSSRLRDAKRRARQRMTEDDQP